MMKGSKDGHRGAGQDYTYVYVLDCSAEEMQAMDPRPNDMNEPRLEGENQNNSIRGWSWREAREAKRVSKLARCEREKSSSGAAG